MAFGIDGKSEANALGRAVDMPEYKDSFRPAPLWERRTGTMKFQEIDVKNLQGNPWRVIGDQWMLINHALGLQAALQSVGDLNRHFLLNLGPAGIDLHGACQLA